MDFISVILARGGSKGIPNKNINDLNGYPLIYYTIKSSIESGAKETWVCTDSEEISKVSIKYGAKCLIRPSNLATDESKSEDSLLFFSERVDFDTLVFIQPTSPLLTPDYIKKGIDLMESGMYDSIFSAYKEHWLPRWGLNNIPYKWDIKNRPMRQEIEEKWVENGAFYITKKENLITSRLRYSGRIGIVEMPFSKSIQVDTIDDLNMVKKLISL